MLCIQKESAHVALNILFSSESFLFLALSVLSLPEFEKLHKTSHFLIFNVTASPQSLNLKLHKIKKN